MDTPVDVQRQVFMTPEIQTVQGAHDVPVVAQRQVARVWVVKKTAEDPQFEIVQKTVENPETQMIQSIQTSESLNNDPDAKIKLFAEEELHGVGGFVSGAHGNRVANELGGRKLCDGRDVEKMNLHSASL